jgi:hypothetical protein
MGVIGCRNQSISNDCSENGIPRFFDIGPPANGQAYNLIDIFTNEPFDARKAFKRLQKVFPQILKDNEANAGKDFYIEPDKLKKKMMIITVMKGPLMACYRLRVDYLRWRLSLLSLSLYAIFYATASKGRKQNPKTNL